MLHPEAERKVSWAESVAESLFRDSKSLGPFLKAARVATKKSLAWHFWMTIVGSCWIHSNHVELWSLQDLVFSPVESEISEIWGVQDCDHGHEWCSRCWPRPESSRFRFSNQPAAFIRRTARYHIRYQRLCGTTHIKHYRLYNILYIL